MTAGDAKRQWYGTNTAILWNVMGTARGVASSRPSHPNTETKEGGPHGGLRRPEKNAHDSEPERIFTDGLRAYGQEGSYGSLMKDPKKIKKAAIGKPHATNNRIERMNGTQRERFKVQRGWKSMQTAMAEGNRIFYNFVRLHMALDGQTPARGWRD